MTAVLLPIRGFRAGKTRLSTTLDVEQRRDLVRMMADTALAAVAGLDVRVITPEADVARWATDRGVDVVRDGGHDLNETLELARGHACADGARSVLVVFADLPALTGDDVDELLTLPSWSGVTLAPDRHDSGTNAVHVGAESGLRYQFGPKSFSLHLAQAPDARVVRRPGLANDVDGASDLRALSVGGLDAPRPSPRPSPRP
jgi:2-phospho-L-lactate/phosphoenolpyruvate guanylyltransferase